MGAFLLLAICVVALGLLSLLWAQVCVATSAEWSAGAAQLLGSSAVVGVGLGSLAVVPWGPANLTVVEVPVAAPPPWLLPGFWGSTLATVETQILVSGLQLSTSDGVCI